MKVVYPVIIAPTGKNEYLVTVPDMDVMTQGNSLENAIFMARDVISIMAVEWLDEGKTLPPASDLHSIKPDTENSVVTLVDADIDAYKRMLDNRAVRKNCTVPSWLNERAERANINFSATLQRGLKQELGLPLNYDPLFSDNAKA